MSSLIPGSLDYTDKDFDALRDRLIRLLRSVFPDWTDFNVLTFGNMLIDLFSFVGDVLTFYQDNQANESFIPTATQRRSIINLSKLIGFELPGQTASQADVKLTLDAVTAGAVNFPAGTIVRTLDVTGAVRFQTLSAVEIPAAADPPEISVTVENSVSESETRASTGLKDQSFLLQFTPFLDGSLDGNISTSQGSWTEVDNFLESISSDRHFTVLVDQNDRATVTFGDGIQGLIPTGTITFDYKTGGGSEGNVEEGDIVVVEGTFQDTLANPVRVTANNAEKAEGGGPRMSVATARILAPLSLRVLNRTVAREDYEINALKVSGVSRSLMLTADQDSSIQENTGFLSIIPTGGGTPSQALKDSVFSKVTVDFPNTITFKTFVVDPKYKTIDVQSTVFLTQGSNPSTVRASIIDQLTSFFALTNIDPDTSEDVPNTRVDFGYNFKDANGDPAGEVPISDVFNVVRDTGGVRKIGDKFEDFLLNGFDRDVEIDIDEFPVLGTITLKNGDTGLDL